MPTLTVHIYIVCDNLRASKVVTGRGQNLLLPLQEVQKVKPIRITMKIHVLLTKQHANATAVICRSDGSRIVFVPVASSPLGTMI